LSSAVDHWALTESIGDRPKRPSPEPFSESHVLPGAKLIDTPVPPLCGEHPSASCVLSYAANRAGLRGFYSVGKMEPRCRAMSGGEGCVTLQHSVLHVRIWRSRDEADSKRMSKNRHRDDRAVGSHKAVSRQSGRGSVRNAGRHALLGTPRKARPTLADHNQQRPFSCTVWNSFKMAASPQWRASMEQSP